MADTLTEITWPLDQPFYTGPGAVPVEEVGLPCSVNGRGFLIDFSDVPGYLYRFRQTTVNLLNTQQANSGGDQSQVPPEVFRRSVETWAGGAGQTDYDRVASVPNRFRDSSNVDVFDPWRVSLLHDTTQVLGLESSPGPALLERCGPDQLVCIVGNVMNWWGSDVTAAPGVINRAVSMLDVTTDGQSMYTLDADGTVTAWVDSATHTVFATGVPVVTGRMLLRYLKGYLVAASGSSLYDVSTGTPTLIYTHPLDAYTWADACEGKGAAYLLGGQGDRWQVHAMQPLNDGTTFAPPVPAGPIPDGEVGHAIASYLGYVLVGLSTGWRFGLASDDGLQVNLGRLIATDNPVHCFEGQDRFVWYGRTADSTTRPAGLGRADLSTFTAELTPAYASDLETTVDVGVVRRIRTVGLGANGLGRRVFTVDGVGVYAESDDLAPSGWLRTGVISFNTSDPKQGLYAQLYTAPLAGRIHVEAFYDRSDTPTDLTTLTSVDSVTAGKIPLAREFSLFEARFTLTRDTIDPTVGPVVTRFELRALPVVGRATEFRIPLIVSESIEYQGTPQSRLPQADVDWLLDLALTKRPFPLRVGTQRYQTYMVDFAWLPEKLDRFGHALDGTFVAICREIG